MKAYDIEVDGQSLKGLVTILDVERTMGPPQKNRGISVKLFIKQDVMKVIDVLNKLLTGSIQTFVFTDQPDRYWLGRVKEKITPTDSVKNSRLTFEIVVPTGVAYAITPKEIAVKNATSVMIRNDGTDDIYPQFDFMLNGETHMLGLSSSKAAYQYGVSAQDSPIKELKISRTATTAGHIDYRKQALINNVFDDWHGWQEADAWDWGQRWHKRGNFTLGSQGFPTPVNGQVTVADWATHWQTGERMADWVKGQTFQVSQTKNVRQASSKKAYLLVNRGQYLGWLLEQDIKGTRSNKNALVPNYGSPSAYKWTGPAMQHSLDSQCTDWTLSYWHYFKLSSANEAGAFFVSVRSGDNEVASALFSAHQYNWSVWQQFSAGGQGLPNDNYDRYMANDFHGRVMISKSGPHLNFEIWNDRKNVRYSKSYYVPDIQSLRPDKVVFWCGRYSTSAPPKENLVDSVEFEGTNTKVWVEPKTETITDVMNVPDYEYTFHSGDMVRINMSDNRAYVNGRPELKPIAYGSRNISVPPGEHEVIITSDSLTKPDVICRYREVFR
ncbi:MULTISPECIES: distal tail protein Dit [Aerococcus]|uniref:Phage tail protein n=1 Tax=Aerococcus tenax TaxID=3078812 RepID=A0A329PH43_9LACT|nr:MULTISPECIES: distal tail protein Dit [Aerococcus]MDL5184723.1 phage tail family protein [Aerococcus mictus]KAA9239976.1 phage tail protein [Aerococcus urinae]MDK6371999.1 phage tail family protein [Aerococcus urinae]MDK7302439.1 phage tail family protein [Aerococcus urinae]MDK7802298.1 phage tail family protein [Aerococcus urinae]